jgi:Fe-S-cluster containining protein
VSSSTARARQRPASLVEAIRQGGPLAQLFHTAAKAQQQSLREILEGRWAENVIDSLHHDASQRVSEGASRSPLQVLHACTPGCNACCRSVAVDVTPLEALAVAEYLRERVDVSQREPILEKLRQNAAARSRMTTAELRRVRLTCAFLDSQGQCSIYASRPLACAGAFSMSRAACENATTNPTAAQQVPTDSYAKAWTMGVSGGLQRALVEAGLDGNLYELSSIVLRALEVPDAAERWLRREDVFYGCTCTEAHSPPRAEARAEARRAA